MGFFNTFRLNESHQGNPATQLDQELTSNVLDGNLSMPYIEYIIQKMNKFLNWISPKELTDDRIEEFSKNLKSLIGLESLRLLFSK